MEKFSRKVPDSCPENLSIWVKRTCPYDQIQDHTLTEDLVSSRVPVVERSVVRESDPRIIQAFYHVKYVSF